MSTNVRELIFLFSEIIITSDRHGHNTASHRRTLSKNPTKLTSAILEPFPYFLC